MKSFINCTVLTRHGRGHGLQFLDKAYHRPQPIELVPVSEVCGLKLSQLPEKPTDYILHFAVAHSKVAF